MVPLDSIVDVDIGKIEEGQVTIRTEKSIYVARGFDAIECVMLLKPSALEGRRMRWNRNAWAFHNFIGHPVTQILSWFRLPKLAVKFHDKTTPTPRGFK